MKSLPVRLVTGSLLIALVIWVLFFAPLWVFAFVTIVFVGAGLNEFFSLVELKGIMIERWIGLAVGLILPISIFFEFSPTKGWELFFVLVVFLSLFLLQLRRRESSEAIVAISTALFGILYISWCFSYLIKLRLFEEGSLDGRWLVAFALAITKGGDIGAYFVGSLFGRHKLITRISPSKTWEGVAGGLLFSVAASFSFIKVFPQVQAVHFLVMGLLLGVLGQLGDLSESMIKRDAQVKDASHALPGLGGVLDVLDSLLFTLPVCYFYIRKFWVGV